MVFFARLYGLSIQTDQQIPGVVNHSEPPEYVDIEVRLNVAPPKLYESVAAEWQPCLRFASRHPFDQGEHPQLIIEETTDGLYIRLSYFNGPRFIYNQPASKIWVTYPDFFTPEHVAHFLLNPALSFALRLRDMVCLHASALVVGDQAILIAGESGAGKSTTTSYFARRGHFFLSDDVSALHLSEDGIKVQPGYPVIRLWSASAKTIFGETHPTVQETPEWEKAHFDAENDGFQFADHPLPIGAVYILKPRAEQISIISLSRPKALMALMNNTSLDYLIDARLRAKDLQLLGQLAGNVPVREVTPPNSLDRLHELYEAILENLVNPLPSLAEHQVSGFTTGNG